MKLLKREWREQKLLAWSLGGLWIFVTAFLWAPSRDGLEAIYALGVFIPMLLLLPWRKPVFQQYGGWFSVSALAYAGWSCLTSLWGAGTGYLLLQWLVLACWLLGSAWVLSQRPLDIDRLMRWLVTIGSLAVVVSLVWFYRNHSLVDRLEGWGAARTPTVVGHVYGVVALLTFILAWRSARYIRALLYTLLALLPLLAMALSQSRGPLVALALALLCAVWWLRPTARILLTQLAIALVLLAAVLLLAPIEQLLMERGISYRDQIWGHVWQAMLDKPLSLLWGVGMSDSTAIATSQVLFHHAHNAWLDIFYRTGALGLGLALLHLALLLFSPGAAPQLGVLRAWLVYGCLCLVVDSRSLFWEIDAKWLLYWVPAALLAACLMLREQQAGPAPSHPHSS